MDKSKLLICPVCGDAYGGAHDCKKASVDFAFKQMGEAFMPAGKLSALDVQVAGGHYKSMKIQPVEFIHANGLGFLEGCIVKRISRWRAKDGIQDLEKIKHEVDLLIELEKKGGAR